MIRKASFTAIIALILASCSHDKPVLPSVRPAGFFLSYHLDSGMGDYSVDLSVRGDSCVYSKKESGKAGQWRFKLDGPGLDSVFALLKKYEFDRILCDTSKEPVHSRGGITIKAAWEDKVIQVSDAQDSYVRENWYEKWKLLCEELDAMMARRAK